VGTAVAGRKQALVTRRVPSPRHKYFDRNP
jgi:hypothetical protein